MEEERQQQDTKFLFTHMNIDQWTAGLFLIESCPELILELVEG